MTLNFVHSFDSMIRMVNHMRLKLNIVDNVEVIFSLAIFVLFYIFESDIVILGENLLSSMILWENLLNSRIRSPFPSELSGVGGKLVFVQSCSSYCSRFGCRRCSCGVLNSLPVDIGKFGNDLGIVVWLLALFRILLR